MPLEREREREKGRDTRIIPSEEIEREGGDGRRNGTRPLRINIASEFGD